MGSFLTFHNFASCVSRMQSLLKSDWGETLLSVLSMPRPAVAPTSLDRVDASEVVARAQGILLDWDGCLAFNDRPLPAALRFLHEHWSHVAIVSNNSTRLPQDFAEILARYGVKMPPRHIILAGAEAVLRAKELQASRVMVIGDNRMKAYARSQGLNLVREDADLVVLMRDPRFTYSKLERAVHCLRAGARLIVSNPDLTHPGQKGRVVPETGALLGAVTACLGAAPEDMEVIGKPSPRLFIKALRALGIR
jgi:4-nitrophenyl phosphatase